MGFFDTYEDGSGLNYVGKEEKGVLIKDAIPFPVNKVTYSATGKYGERFTVHTTLDGEDRALTFGAGSVESRDRMLEALREYLTTEDAEPPEVFLEQIGQSVLIRAAVTS